MENKELFNTQFILKIINTSNNNSQYLRIQQRRNGDHFTGGFSADTKESLDMIVRGFAWYVQGYSGIQLEPHYSFAKPSLFPQETIGYNGVIFKYEELTSAEQEEFRTKLQKHIELVNSEAEEAHAHWRRSRA